MKPGPVCGLSNDPSHTTTTSGNLGESCTWCVTLVAIDISQDDGGQVDREDIIPRHSKIRTEQAAWDESDKGSRIGEIPHAGDKA